MAKYFGKIGYAQTIERTPGVWVEEIIEREHYGDITRNKRRLTGSGVNDDISLGNEFSIVSDPFAIENFHAIRYIEYMGTKWKVSDVEVQYPRLILSAGGVYNEQET